LGIFGNEFGGACGDGKWVNIGIKGIDAFIKGINMHIGAITIGGGGGGSLKLKAIFKLCYLFLALKL
jgi:hypothetical protein